MIVERARSKGPEKTIVPLSNTKLFHKIFAKDLQSGRPVTRFQQRKESDSHEAELFHKSVVTRSETFIHSQTFMIATSKNRK